MIIKLDVYKYVPFSNNTVSKRQKTTMIMMS